jgi:hypothetical protein
MAASAAPGAKKPSPQHVKRGVAKKAVRAGTASVAAVVLPEAVATVQKRMRKINGSTTKSSSRKSR